MAASLQLITLYLCLIAVCGTVNVTEDSTTGSSVTAAPVTQGERSTAEATLIESPAPEPVQLSSTVMQPKLTTPAVTPVQTTTETQKMTVSSTTAYTGGREPKVEVPTTPEQTGPYDEGTTTTPQPATTVYANTPIQHTEVTNVPNLEETTVHYSNIPTTEVSKTTVSSSNPSTTDSVISVSTTVSSSNPTTETQVNTEASTTVSPRSTYLPTEPASDDSTTSTTPPSSTERPTESITVPVSEATSTQPPVTTKVTASNYADVTVPISSGHTHDLSTEMNYPTTAMETPTTPKVTTPDLAPTTSENAYAREENNTTIPEASSNDTTESTQIAESTTLEAEIPVVLESEEGADVTVNETDVVIEDVNVTPDNSTQNETKVDDQLETTITTSTPAPRRCLAFLSRPALRCRGCKSDNDCEKDESCCPLFFRRGVKCCGKPRRTG